MIRMNVKGSLKGETTPTECCFLRYKYRKVKGQLLPLALRPFMAVTMVSCSYLTLLSLLCQTHRVTSFLPSKASSSCSISLPLRPVPALIRHCRATSNLSLTASEQEGAGNESTVGLKCVRESQSYFLRPVKTMNGEISKKCVPSFPCVKFRKYFRCLLYSQCCAGCYQVNRPVLEEATT